MARKSCTWRKTINQKGDYSAMRTNKNFCVLLLFVTIVFISGCPKQRFIKTAEEVRDIIAEAKADLKLIKEFEESELYPEELKEAEDSLNNALAELKKGKKANRDQAYLYAKESLDVSEQIRIKIITGVVGEKIKEHERKILEKGEDTSLKDLLPRLYAIKQKIKDLETKQQKKLSWGEFRGIKGESENIGGIIERHVEESIESDVSFGEGEYKIEDISEEGKQRLEEVVRKFIAAKDAHTKKFPNYKDAKTTIRIDVYGYTDELPFIEGTRLVRELEQGPEIVPQTSPEDRRKALNQNLSQFRAESIGNYLTQRLSETLGVEPEVRPFGRGENIATDENGKHKIPPPYPIKDPRRRICKIDGYCEIK
jgi:hypothetical protein